MLRVNTLGALVCVILLTTEVLGSYNYMPEINGWVKIHKLIATWDDAFQHCEKQSAVLMSPNNMKLYTAMVTMNEDNTTYFLGTRARFEKNIFVSVEGVPLYDMPVTHMSSQFNPQDGECLSMNRDFIRIVPCTLQLPYMCYKEKKEDMVLTECGTFDKRYKFNKITGSCYKFHAENVTWEDAYASCMAEGSYLTIINNKKEEQELYKIIVINEYKYSVHVGIRCLDEKWNCLSVQGHRLHQIYNKWDDSESPTKSFGVYEYRTSVLNTIDYKYKCYYVCERDPKYVMFPEK